MESVLSLHSEMDYCPSLASEALNSVMANVHSHHWAKGIVRPLHLEMGYRLSLASEALTESEARRAQGKGRLQGDNSTLQEANHKTPRLFSRLHQSCTLDRGRTASYNLHLFHCYSETEHAQFRPMMTEKAVHGNLSQNTAQ